jgi:molecular chaperone DnaK (HSP70)
MSRDHILGIDFGSSSTVAGVLIGDRIELAQDAGGVVIPSVVYVPDRGPPEIGRRASARQLTEPTRVVRSVKRILGLPADAELVRHYAASVPFRVEHAAGAPSRPSAVGLGDAAGPPARPSTIGDRITFKLASGDVVPEQVAAWILARVRELAEQRFGGRIRKAVMTMSAAAPAGYRDALVRAARIAHLDIVDLVAEPIAGALALDLHTRPAQRRIVVCDFGGGTFDVSAVVQQHMAFTPIAAHGDHYLGGDDLDSALAEAIAGLVYRSSHYDMHKDAVRWNELVLRCESAKRQLSSCAEAPLAMRQAYISNGNYKDLQLLVDHPWVEAVWGPLRVRLTGVVHELLRRASWRAEDVEVVGLIGGSSLVPMFRAAMADIFGQDKLLITPDAELAVAQGATLLTARHRRLRSNSIPILVDV